MQAILVVVDESEPATHVLQAAAERAERKRAALVVVHVLPEAAYQRRQSAIMGIANLRRDGFTYTITRAAEDARVVADRAASAAIGESGVPYTAVGVVGRPVTAVLNVAAAYHCNDIMIAATKPTWFGFFKGFDRALAKRFDGKVIRVERPRLEPADPVSPVPEA